MITDKIKSKKMKELSEYGARTMGNGMAGDFGPKPTDDEEDELSEDGFPGGVITGLVSPGGYINGAPKPKDVAKTSKKIHKNKETNTNKDYVYDPVSELISKLNPDDVFTYDGTKDAILYWENNTTNTNNVATILNQYYNNNAKLCIVIINYNKNFWTLYKGEYIRV